MHESTCDSPVCHACTTPLSQDLLGGLCPKCLLRAGFQEQDGRLHVRCPECHMAIQVGDDVSVREVICPDCDSRFSLVGDAAAAADCSAGGAIGRFQLIDRVGLGTFGAVWKASDPELERMVAIKIPRKEQLAPGEVELFLREARSAAQLKHPGIVSVHEVGRDDDRIYIVSDFVEGLTLADMLSTQRVPLRECVELCRQMAEALQHAHERGVIHRDLKPSNVILDGVGRPHVMDFGLAKREAADVTMTVEGRILGTPAYMSPEQARGDANLADGRSDIYSLGVILFELLTGEKPFRGSSQMLLHQVLHEDAPSPRKLNAAVPRDLETICLRCLEKSPDRRFDTARDLADELARFLEGRPIRSRPITVLQRALRWCQRNRLVASLLLLTGLALAAGTALASFFAIQASERADRERSSRRWAQQREGEARAASEEAAEARHLAERRLNVSQRSAYALQLAHAHLQLPHDPAAAHALLEDEQFCPMHLRDFSWRYLHHRATPGLQVLEATAFSHFAADGQRAIYLDADGRGVTDVEIATGRRNTIFKVQDHDECVAAVSPDSRFVLTADQGSWHKPRFRQAKRLKLRERESSDEVAAFAAQDAPVKKLGFAPTAETLAIRHGSRVSVLEVPSLDILMTIDNIPPDAAFEYSPDGGSLAVEAKDKVEIWNLESLERTRSIAVDSAESLAFASDGQTLAVGAHPEATLWNVATGSKIATLREGVGTDFKALAFSPDGQTLATSSTDFPIRLWDIRTSEKWATLTGSHSHGPLTFSPDGRVLASASVKFWRVPEREASGVPMAGEPVISGVFWPDNRTVAAGLESPPRLWDAHTGTPVGKVDMPPIYNLVTSRDGQLLAAAGLADVKIIGARDATVLKSIPAGNTWAMNFSPDGRTLATTTMNTRFIDLWNWEGGTRIARLEADRLSVLSLDFSPDGSLLAAGMGEQPRPENPAGHVHVWDIAQGEIVQTLDGFRFGVYCLVFSPDGKTLATGSQSIRLWDIPSWSVRSTMSEHTNIVWRLAYAPDGRTLASGSFDSTVRLWDPVIGRQRLAIDKHSYWVTVLAFSPEGDSLLTGSTDALRVWPAPSPHSNGNETIAK